MAVVHFDGLELFSKDFHLLHDFFDFFCGSLVGEGNSRSVYEYALDKSYVVKIQRSETGSDVRSFENVHEFDAYFNLSHHHPKLASFLAPTTRISSCGRLLLMRRTTPIGPKQKMPKAIPAFLTDTKIQNWGKLPNGKIVCHDYANNKIFSKINTRMIKPQWWSDSYQNKMNLK